jgi:pyruvate dehydrogenase E2 component (dihydrolipoamide acetyltransferase)
LRTLTAAQGFDIAQIPGTGPGGRVIAQDVLGFQPAPAGVRAAAAIISEHYTDQQLTNLRKIIAQRLTESKQQIPHYYLTSECRVDKLLKYAVVFFFFFFFVFFPSVNLFLASYDEAWLKTSTHITLQAPY